MGRGKAGHIYQCSVTEWASIDLVDSGHSAWEGCDTGYRWEELERLGRIRSKKVLNVRLRMSSSISKALRIIGTKEQDQVCLLERCLMASMKMRVKEASLEGQGDQRGSWNCSPRENTPAGWGLQ